jgi:hypothetical protein
MAVNQRFPEEGSAQVDYPELSMMQLVEDGD